MDRFPQMLYRVGLSEQIHGGRFDTRIVGDDAELDQAKAEGWHETTPDAVEANLQALVAAAKPAEPPAPQPAPAEATPAIDKPAAKATKAKA